MDNYNLIHCVKGKKYDNLNDLLNQLDDELLNEISYFIFKKEIKMNKKVLIKKISKQILNQKFIEDVLINLVNKEFNIFKKIVTNDGIIEDNDFILNDLIIFKLKGILYLVNEDDRAYLIIPKEILEIVKNIELDSYRNQVEKNTRLNDLAISMINLYGIVKFEDYIDACFKYYNYEDIMEINILSVFESSRFNPVTIFDLEEVKYITKEEFLEDGSFELLKSRIYDSEYRSISLKDISISNLLQYKELFFYETSKETDKLKDYLSNFSLSNEDIDSLVSVIVETIRIDYTSGIYFFKDILSDFNIELNEDNIDEFLLLVNNIYYSIPIWGSKGWTMKELLLSDFII